VKPPEEMTYLDEPPADLPADLIVTHNLVIWTGQKAGEDGFRFWTEPVTERARRVPCLCAWGRPEVAEHYMTGPRP
jgi:hypothetical protein